MFLEWAEDRVGAAELFAGVEALDFEVYQLGNFAI